MKQILEVVTRTGDSTGIMISDIQRCKMDWYLAAFLFMKLYMDFFL